MIIISNTSRNLILSARVSADEKEIIERKAYESYRTVSTYLRECGLEKTIVSVRGLDVVATELRRIGNNINQLTRAVNSGQLYSINLYETQERLGELWQLLNMLILEARWPWATAADSAFGIVCCWAKHQQRRGINSAEGWKRFGYCKVCYSGLSYE